MARVSELASEALQSLVDSQRTAVKSLITPVFNVMGYGAMADGATDDSTAFLDTIAAAAASSATGGMVWVPPGSYYLGTTQIVILPKVNFIGSGRSTSLTYAGTGKAIKLSGCTGSVVGNFIIFTTNDAGCPFDIGNASRNCTIENIYAEGTNALTTTGSAFYLDAGTGWSGGLAIRDCYALGYKYGVKMIGTHIDNNTWTTVDMTNLWLVGRSAGIIPGSAGIYMDALTNGAGTYLRGGTIEAMDTGIQVLDGGFGGSFECDMEGNNADYSVGSTFNGYIKPAFGGRSFEQWTNGSTNKWLRERMLSGVFIRETQYNQQHVINEGSGSDQEHGFYRGASLIDGGSPHAMLRSVSGGSPYTDPAHNFTELNGHKITHHTGIPTSGTWAVDDICFLTKHDRGTAQDGIVGYVCTTAGTPGTWVPFAYQNIDGSKDWNPGAIGGSTLVSTTITMSGWGITNGNYVEVSPPYDVTDLMVFAYVKSATVIQINVYNPTGAPITLGNGTWRVRVRL